MFFAGAVTGATVTMFVLCLCISNHNAGGVKDEKEDLVK